MVIFPSIAFPEETRYTIALVNQERNLAYLTVSSASQTAPVVITPEQIAAYYKAHQDEFKTPEQISVDYLELSLKDVIASTKPTLEAMKTYYNENINNYSKPGQWKLEFI